MAILLKPRSNKQGLVDTTADLANVEGRENYTVLVKDTGLFEWVPTGTVDGTNIIAAKFGYWSRVLQSGDAAFNYTPENVANKSTSTALGTSNTLYPTQNAVKVYVDSNAGLPYSVYTALITFDGTAVTATVLTNTLGQTITWTNPSNGVFRADSTGTPFAETKTWITSGGYDNGSSPMIVTSERKNPFPTSRIEYSFFLHDGTKNSTPLIQSYPVEIRVYP